MWKNLDVNVGCELRLLVALWAKSEWKMTREGCKRTRWLETQDHAGWARSRGATTWRGGPRCESRRHGERNHGRWFGKRESCGMVGFVMGCNFAARHSLDHGGLTSAKGMVW
ncbi:hypothetical protein ACSQ67_015797 [Phaseolus vulgaris]